MAWRLVWMAFDAPLPKTGRFNYYTRRVLFNLTLNLHNLIFGKVVCD